MASTNEQKPVTKKELDMTKQELLGRLACKEDLKQFATKKDVEILAIQIANLTQRMISVENQLIAVQDTSNLILEIVEGIAKKIDDAQTETAATNHTFRRHENRLKNHEERIETLEKGAS